MTALPIPAWPDPTTPEGKTFFANAIEIFDLWKSYGKSNQFALGMLANAEAETSLNPNERGDYIDANGKPLPWSVHPVGTPTAFGLHQWHEGRVAIMKLPPPKGCGVDIMALPPIADQIRAANWELDTFTAYGRSAITAASTAYGAAYQACVLFERAGAANAADRRGKMAERFAVWFSKQGTK